ncbi:MAG TPA: TonB-dependent receptor [Longimicrobiales bacterium]|nr:TonB-dependent receptor [Longimicrobiales bacterium]
MNSHSRTSDSRDVFSQAVARVQAAGPLRTVRTSVARLLIALIGLAAADPARAQIADSARSTPLDTLVVEALRMPTAGRLVPWALTAITEEDTRTGRAGRGLAEALHGVPGLQASDRSNDALGERIVIRGSGARAAFGVRGVRVLIDGIPATLPDGQTDLSRLDMATIGRVEVLRGPASSLYGNASGGVLLISSAEPPAASVAAQVEALTGSDGLLRLHARIAGRPGLAWYDASATHRTLDGFREHAGSEKTFLRIAAGMPVSVGQLDVQATGLTYDAQNPGSLAADVMAQDREQAHAFNVAQRAGESARQALAGVTWRGAAGPGTLELATYGTARVLDNPIPVSIIELTRAAGGLRGVYGLDFEADRSGDDAGAMLILGAELDAQRDDRRNFDNDGGAKGARTLDQLERVQALGLFTHARLPLGTRMDASAGLRFDRFGFDVEDRLTEADPDDSGSRTMHALSPSLALNARLARALHLFANVATSFETPTTTELANRPDGAGGFNPDLEPQRTLSFEAGARAALAAARLELAVWQSRTADALVPFEVSDAPGRQFFHNAGSATHRGVEAALGVEWPRAVQWELAYAWIDARFDDFAVDSVSFAGNRVPGVAPHRIDLGVGSRGERWFAGVEATWSAAVPVDDANSEEADAYGVVDARAEWRLPVGLVGVWLFGGVRNVLDEDYVGSVVVNAFGARYYEPAPGRTVYVGLRAGLGYRSAAARGAALRAPQSHTTTSSSPPKPRPTVSTAPHAWQRVATPLEYDPGSLASGRPCVLTCGSRSPAGAGAR